MRPSGAILTAILALAALAAAPTGSLAAGCAPPGETATAPPPCPAGHAAESAPCCCAGPPSQPPGDCCGWTPAGKGGGGPAAVAPSAPAVGFAPPSMDPPKFVPPARCLCSGGPDFSPPVRCVPLRAVLLI